MKKLSLVNLSKEKPLTKDDLKKLKGGIAGKPGYPGTCYCQCACTFASKASAHNSSDVKSSSVDAS